MAKLLQFPGAPKGEPSLCQCCQQEPVLDAVGAELCETCRLWILFFSQAGGVIVDDNQPVAVPLAQEVN